MAWAHMLGACATTETSAPQTPRAPSEPEASPAAPAPGTETVENKSIVVDGTGISLRGECVAETDNARIVAGIFGQGRTVPQVDVAPDATLGSLSRVLENGWDASAARIATRMGTWEREFFVGRQPLVEGSKMVAMRVADRETVRFWRFIGPSRMDQAARGERHDWKPSDASATNRLGTWLAEMCPESECEDLDITASSTLAMSDLAGVLSRLDEIWPRGRTIRVGLHALAVTEPVHRDRWIDVSIIPGRLMSATLNVMYRALSDCGLKEDAKAGTKRDIHIEISIDAEGAVSVVVRSQGPEDDKTTQCWVDGLKSLRFPARAGALPQTVNLRFKT
jgi:hypothetical protein